MRSFGTPNDLAKMSELLQTEQNPSTVKEESSYSPIVPRAPLIDDSSECSDSSSPDDLPDPVAWIVKTCRPATPTV